MKPVIRKSSRSASLRGGLIFAVIPTLSLCGLAAAQVGLPVDQPAVKAASPTEPSTWARFVPERKDDFAWENDLIAFRVYGPAIKGNGEGEDSGIDCWFKRVPYPIVDKWYEGELKHGKGYHTDHGEGYDAYSVGGSRGCGGLAIWKDGQMLRSGPYKTSNLISRTKEKSVFELTYEYDLDGAKIQEVKRITIELGKRLFDVTSTFTRDGKPADLNVAVGVTTHGGKAKATLNPTQGWMSCWEKTDGFGVGTGVVMKPAQVIEMREVKSNKKDESHALLLTRTDANGQVSYSAGFGWEKAGVITSPEKWQAYLTQAAGFAPAV
ncbi:DUF4861 domain-containing protein [bacterium]|nr:MAG: DUF4861 domain-containing protein [bacterium]